MDYLHAGYTCAARYGPLSSDTFAMRWYRAAPGARVYQGLHAFGSTVFDDDYQPENEGPGEIPHSRTWSPSVLPIADGTQDVVTPDSLLHGLPSGSLPNLDCYDAVLSLDADYAEGGCLTTEDGGHILLETGAGCILWA